MTTNPERTVAEITACFVHQTVGYFAATCDRCGAQHDAGRAISADTPGLCATCAIRDEVG